MEVLVFVCLHAWCGYTGAHCVRQLVVEPSVPWVCVGEAASGKGLSCTVLAEGGVREGGRGLSDGGRFRWRRAGTIWRSDGSCGLVAGGAASEVGGSQEW